MLRKLAFTGAAGCGGAYIAYSHEWSAGAALQFARFDGIVRPALAAALPEPAFVWLYSASRTKFIEALSRCESFVPAPLPPSFANGREKTVLGLKFRNDLGNSAGLDKDGSLLEFSYRLGAGFTVVGTGIRSPAFS